MDYSLFAMFLLLLFGTTTWHLYKGIMMKVENIERIVSITYEILVIGEPVSKEVTEQVAADRKNTQEIQAWDKS